VSERKSAAMSVIKTVIGIYARNFPVIPGRTIIGIKTTMVVIVHAISGALKSLTARRTAVLGEYHRFILSYAASTITMDVSIAIHNVKTRLKFVRKFKVNHNRSRTVNVTKKARIIHVVAINASLIQTNKNRQSSTNTIVVTQFLARLL
jgi:hypothetical protein